jgi:ankyrin repeat protein
MKYLLPLLPLLLIVGVSAPAQTPSPEQVVNQALIEFAFKGNLPELQQLVSAGVSVNVHDDQKRTPLMWASFNGHTPVVGYLLEQGAKVDAKDVSGRTALMYASSGPFKETVALLLKQGADVDIQGTLEGFTALMTAAAEGQLEVVRLLLVHGANSELKDLDGDTAESFAEQKGHPEVVALFNNPPPRIGGQD